MERIKNTKGRDMELLVCNVEEAPTSADDWKNVSIIERFLAIDKIRSDYHNGEAGLNAGLVRVARIVDMPEY